MLINSKIFNLREVAVEYLEEVRNLESPTTEDVEGVNGETFACKLCLRFLTDPVRHRPCKSFFCRACLLEWASEFEFCIVCKKELLVEEVYLEKTDPQMLKIIQSIRLECNYGNCLFEQPASSRGTSEDLKLNMVRNNRFMKNALKYPKKKKNLEQIEEKSLEYDSNASELHSFSGYWEGDNHYTLPRKANYINLSKKKSKIKSNAVQRRSSNRRIQQVQPPASNKRLFGVQEFTFHLMRQHFWPPMQSRKVSIPVKSNRNFKSSLKGKMFLFSDAEDDPHLIINKNEIKTFSFCGYAKDKKSGPGVIYYVHRKKRVDAHFGLFQADRLSDNGTILMNGKLVFDGSIVDGRKEGLAVQRFYIEIDRDIRLDSIVDEKKDRVCFLEYRGHFKHGQRNGFGKMFFNGNFQVFKEYFRKIRILENLKKARKKRKEAEEVCPIGIPVITNYVDSTFNAEKIFEKLPVVLVDSLVVDSSQCTKTEQSITTEAGTQYAPRLLSPFY